MEKKIVNFSSIVESNGRTIRQNNLEIHHQFSVGSLVQFRYSEWFGDGACRRSEARMFVAYLSRDCDGTPLYTLASKPPSVWYEYSGIEPSHIFCDFSKRNVHLNSIAERLFHLVHNISEESLTLVHQTPEVLRGEEVLRW